VEKILNADSFLSSFSSKGSNMTFEKQKNLRKVIVEPAEMGSESEYESDLESIAEKNQEPNYN